MLCGGGTSPASVLDKQRLKAFHDAVLFGYRQAIQGDKNVLFKMKELWFYQIRQFDGAEKPAKRIKKAQTLAEYEVAVSGLLG